MMKKAVAALTLIATMIPATFAATPSFSDEVSFSSWFADAVANLHVSGVVTGFPDGSFRPEATVTRAELAVMLARFAQFAGIDLNPGAKICTMEYRYGLTIHLYDQNGHALDGVTITSMQNGDKSDAFTSFQPGTYTGIGEGKGLYTVEATKDGYMPITESITLAHDGCHVMSQVWTRVMPKVQ